MKAYIQSSPHYAWKVLEGEKSLTPSNNQKEDVYLKKKNAFRKLRVSKSNCIHAKNIDEVLGKNRHEILPFFVLKAYEDEDLMQKYLGKIETSGSKS